MNRFEKGSKVEYVGQLSATYNREAFKVGYLKAWHTALASAFEEFCNDLLYEFEPRSANSEAEAEVCEWLESYIERAKAEALK